MNTTHKKITKVKILKRERLQTFLVNQQTKHKQFRDLIKQIEKLKGN